MSLQNLKERVAKEKINRATTYENDGQVDFKTLYQGMIDSIFSDKSLHIEDVDNRYRDAVNLHTVKNWTVAQLGVGGIGSPTVQTLVGMGINNYHIFDDDTVETHNCGPQMHPITNIGKLKVTSTAEQMLGFRGVKIHEHPQRVEKLTDMFINGKCPDVIINGVDNMNIRRTLGWEFFTPLFETVKDGPVNIRILPPEKFLTLKGVKVVIPQVFHVPNLKMFMNTFFKDVKRIIEYFYSFEDYPIAQKNEGLVPRGETPLKPKKVSPETIEFIKLVQQWTIMYPKGAFESVVITSDQETPYGVTEFTLRLGVLLGVIIMGDILLGKPHVIIGQPITDFQYTRTKRIYPLIQLGTESRFDQQKLIPIPKGVKHLEGDDKDQEIPTILYSGFDWPMGIFDYVSPYAYGADDHLSVGSRMRDAFRQQYDFINDDFPEVYIDSRMSLGTWNTYILPIRSILKAHYKNMEKVAGFTHCMSKDVIISLLTHSTYDDLASLVDMYDAVAEFVQEALFDGSEAIQEPCTARAIVYTGTNIASYIGGA